MYACVCIWVYIDLFISIYFCHNYSLWFICFTIVLIWCRCWCCRRRLGCYHHYHYHWYFLYVTYSVHESHASKNYSILGAESFCWFCVCRCVCNGCSMLVGSCSCKCRSLRLTSPVVNTCFSTYDGSFLGGGGGGGGGGFLSTSCAESASGAVMFCAQVRGLLPGNMDVFPFLSFSSHLHAWLWGF